MQQYIFYSVIFSYSELNAFGSHPEIPNYIFMSLCSFTDAPCTYPYLLYFTLNELHLTKYCFNHSAAQNIDFLEKFKRKKFPVEQHPKLRPPRTSLWQTFNKKNIVNLRKAGFIAELDCADVPGVLTNPPVKVQTWKSTCLETKFMWSTQEWNIITKYMCWSTFLSCF